MGEFFGQSGRCRHGTPEAVPGDRDVTHMSISGRSDLSVRCPKSTHENEWNKLYTRQSPRIGPWGFQGPQTSRDGRVWAPEKHIMHMNVFPGRKVVYAHLAQISLICLFDT